MTQNNLTFPPFRGLCSRHFYCFLLFCRQNPLPFLLSDVAPTCRIKMRICREMPRDAVVWNSNMQRVHLDIHVKRRVTTASASFSHRARRWRWRRCDGSMVSRTITSIYNAIQNTECCHLLLSNFIAASAWHLTRLFFGRSESDVLIKMLSGA